MQDRIQADGTSTIFHQELQTQYLGSMALLEVHKTVLTSFTRKKKMSSSLDCIHLYTNVVVHALFNTSQWKKRPQKKNPNAQGTGQIILQYTMR